MASPPPPLAMGIPNSKKRASTSSHVSLSGAPSKRPKLHPLRQTSFPANLYDPALHGSGAQSARSETGSVAHSAFSTASNGKRPRGRGRPRKSLQVPDDDAARTVHDQPQSGIGGKGAGARSVVSAARSGGPNDGGVAEDDEDDEREMEELWAQTDTAAEVAEEERQIQRIIRLKDAMTRDQEDRYNAWRAGQLKTSTVRRIVNQTVSQSVGQTPIEAVKFYGKAFAIEIIERAREIQEECARAYDVTIADEKASKTEKLRKKEQDLARLEEEEKRQLDDEQKRERERELEPEHEREREKERGRAQEEEEKEKERGIKQGVENERKSQGTPVQKISEQKSAESRAPEKRTPDRKSFDAEKKSLQRDVAQLKKEAEKYAPNKHRGGLLPDHLREALRRYKADGDGGGVGFDGLSHPLLSVQGSAVWRHGDGVTGRKLFR